MTYAAIRLSPCPTDGPRLCAAPQPIETMELSVPFPENWRGERGAVVDDRVIRLRSVGPADGPVVVVMGGVSAGRAAASLGAGKSWWGDIVRPGGPVDIARVRVVTADFFPLAPEAALDLTTADYADVFVAALRRAGFLRIDAFIGASFGGMVGLKIAERHGSYLGRLCVLNASHCAAPMARAWRRVQRRIVELGLDLGAGEAAIAIARELAITTYRTPEEFNVRFAGGCAADRTLDTYLEKHGRDYAGVMAPARFLTLSGAIDSHDAAPEAIMTPTWVIATDSDRLVPVGDVEALARRLGGRARLDVISSVYGHDAFLKEPGAVGPLLRAFLEETR